MEYVIMENYTNFNAYFFTIFSFTNNYRLEWLKQNVLLKKTHIRLKIIEDCYIHILYNSST